MALKEHFTKILKTFVPEREIHEYIPFPWENWYQINGNVITADSCPTCSIQATVERRRTTVEQFSSLDFSYSHPKYTPGYSRKDERYHGQMNDVTIYLDNELLYRGPGHLLTYSFEHGELYNGEKLLHIDPVVFVGTFSLKILANKTTIDCALCGHHEYRDGTFREIPMYKYESGIFPLPFDRCVLSHTRHTMCTFIMFLKSKHRFGEFYDKNSLLPDLEYLVSLTETELVHYKNIHALMKNSKIIPLYDLAFEYLRLKLKDYDGGLTNIRCKLSDFPEINVLKTSMKNSLMKKLQNEFILPTETIPGLNKTFFETLHIRPLDKKYVLNRGGKAYKCGNYRGNPKKRGGMSLFEFKMHYEKLHGENGLFELPMKQITSYLKSYGIVVYHMKINFNLTNSTWVDPIRNSNFRHKNYMLWNCEIK